MTASVRKIAPTEVELDIEIAPDELDRARDKAFARLARQFKLPGFRSGRVPRRIFEQHVGAEHIEHEAIEDLVPDAYSAALREYHLQPVDRPHFDLERLDDGKALRIKAKVSVRPEIELHDYVGIEVRKPPDVTSDEDVERSLQALRKRAAVLEPVTQRGLAAGDVATVDYIGSIDGVPFEGGSAENHTTEMTPGRFVPGFVERLEGIKPGEERRIEVTFPDGYANAKLAGKVAVFDVKLIELKTPVLPDLDAAFVKQISDFETVDELRADVRRRLEAVAESESRRAMQDQLLATLVERHDVPLPEVLVQRELNSLVADAKNYIERIGKSWHEYLAAKQTDEAGLQAEYRVEAERRVKTSLLLEALAEREQISVEAAEVDRELRRMAEAYGRTHQQMVALLRRNEGFGVLVESLRKEKTVTWLLDHATVLDGDRTAETPTQQGAYAGEASKR